MRPMPASRRQFRLRLPRRLYLRLSALAQQEGSDVNSVVLRAVRADLERSRPRKGDDKP